MGEYREPFCDMLVDGQGADSAGRTSKDKTVTRPAPTSIAPRWDDAQDWLELQVNLLKCGYVDVRLHQNKKSPVCCGGLHV